MASNDLQMMDKMLTTVGQQIKTFLRKIGESRHGFDPEFKQIFFQAISTQAAAAYSNIEMELQLKLQLGRSGIANCEAGSSSMNINIPIGTAGQVRGGASGFRAKRSNNIGTTLQIMDSSDDEDVKPVVIKTEATIPADRTDHQGSNKMKPSVEPNEMNASGEKFSTKSPVQSEETLVINSSINISAQLEQEIPQQYRSTPSQISLQNKSATDVGSTANAKRPSRKPYDRAEASTSVGSVKTDAARNKRKCHKCKLCGYVAGQKCDLVVHMRTHTGERPYQCERCLKKFTTSSGLKHHQLVHVKGYKFRCVGCVRGFKDEKEKIAHDRECKKRRYECHLCKKYSTVRKSGLLRHMRTHSGEKPFQCLICLKWYQRKFYLKKHLDTIHGTKN